VAKLCLDTHRPCIGPAGGPSAFVLHCLFVMLGGILKIARTQNANLVRTVLESNCIKNNACTFARKDACDFGAPKIFFLLLNCFGASWILHVTCIGPAVGRLGD